MKPAALKLSVHISKQGKRYVAYSPALDISTSGMSEKDVRKKFEELVDIFFEELDEMGTVGDVLAELGWRKVRKQWSPPEVVSNKTVSVRAPAPVAV